MASKLPVAEMRMSTSLRTDSSSSHRSLSCRPAACRWDRSQSRSCAHQHPESQRARNVCNRRHCRTWTRDQSFTLMAGNSNTPSPPYLQAVNALRSRLSRSKFGTSKSERATSRSWTAASLRAVSLVPPEGGSLRAGCRGPFPLHAVRVARLHVHDVVVAVWPSGLIPAEVRAPGESRTAVGCSPSSPWHGYIGE